MKIAQEIFSKVHKTYEREYVDIVNDLAVFAMQVRSNVYTHKDKFGI